MNLSSMMYRLNVQQQQQQQSSQQSQSQSQQSAQSSHQQQQQHQLQQQQQQQQSVAATSTATTNQIPSHILLQQQLNAAAAAAAAATGNPAADCAPSLNGAAAVAASVVAQPLLAHQQHHLTPQHLQHQQSHILAQRSSAHQSHHQQQQQQQQQHHLSHSHHHQNASTSSNAAAAIIAASSSSAAAAVPTTTIVTVSSVEDKIKLLSTAIKAEPLHDVIALTTAISNNNSNNNNNSNGNIALSGSSSSNNNSGNINASSGSNIIALTVGTNPNSSCASNAANVTTSKIASVSPATSAALAASAAGSSNLNNVNNTINLVVGTGNAGIANAVGASTSAAAVVISGGAGTSSSSSNASAGASSSAPNGHLVFVPSKRARLDAPEDWISTPSPGSVPSSAPPLSPSPGSQHHSYSANMSNGYASPMSAGSYDPYSPNGKTGRDDLSPSSSLNGYSANESCDAKKSKKGPAPRLQEELCLVCGDRASGYHYNALTCEGCKGFFRRSVTKNAVYCCKFGHACEMDMYMRRKCQECRLKKCLAVGMRPECVVPENQCAMKRREKKAQKEKDKQQASPSVSTTDNSVKKEILELMTCDPPTHPTCPLLPDDILAKCHARSIPSLTFNQLAVIYKLIWYQDGYEQPSEEDLKRIMSTPDENESPHDISFRHITEITILTVQLIVEFAKGLPAFTKIPQEDQITLLKACSSEVMMLRMARRYDHNSDSIFFANNRSYTRDAYKMAGVADNIEDLLHFCRQMYSMKVDNVEYALLTAIVIFSDRPGLEEAELVEAIQRYYIDTLKVYILNRHCGDPMSLVFFAKLLSILTELRTLGNQNAEMCFSLKLKNRKLPKFLEEIWDVHAIPPSVQSHIQATNSERDLAEAATTPSTSTAAAAVSASADVGSIATSSTAAAAAAAASSSAYVGASTSAGTTTAASLNGALAPTSSSAYGNNGPVINMMGGVMKQEHLMGGSAGMGGGENSTTA